MRNNLAFCVIAFHILGITAFAKPAYSAEFSKLLAKADELATHGSGTHFDNAVGKFTATTFGPVMKRCLTETPNPSYTHFDVVAVLAASGNVEELMVRPETNLSSCIFSAIKSAQFPMPPSEHYPVHLDWNFTK